MMSNLFAQSVELGLDDIHQHFRCVIYMFSHLSHFNNRF